MSNHLAYQEAAEQLDRKLDRDLAALRARQDSGDVTTRQAADLRVAILTEHLSALAQLRVEHFGTDPGDGGWISGSCTNP